MKSRLPVLLELDKRGMDLHSVRCPLCNGDLESVDHTLVGCSKVKEIWIRVFNWWGLGSFSSNTLSEIIGGVGSPSTSGQGGLIWQALSWICLYLIWKNRNKRVFQGKTWKSPMALSEIQTLSFHWIANRLKKEKIEWLSWLSSPSSYLQSL
ncbi:uncharacterized protein [Rutidosis leptorrhynchoides]|uniref:uncharacterized protein n=1 Tax=Rutidosis leptorrhynchoides TaxID=125765 RepID=UPI003A99CA05